MIKPQNIPINILILKDKFIRKNKHMYVCAPEQTTNFIHINMIIQSLGKLIMKLIAMILFNSKLLRINWNRN